MNDKQRTDRVAIAKETFKKSPMTAGDEERLWDALGEQGVGCQEVEDFIVDAIGDEGPDAHEGPSFSPLTQELGVVSERNLWTRKERLLDIVKDAVRAEDFKLAAYTLKKYDEEGK